MRYFALYPFGAVVHLFLNEFLDHKDSGTAILSHFYLLAGCAGPLWLEGSVLWYCKFSCPLIVSCRPSRILEFTGVLSLGIGDALVSVHRMGEYNVVTKQSLQASIAGRRIGRHRWSPSSSKTLEGSATFVLSVVFSAWGLRAAGVVPFFPVCGTFIVDRRG